MGPRRSDIYIYIFFFGCAEAFKFYVVSLFIFYFIVCALGVMSEKLLPRTRSGKFFSCFLLRVLWFQVLHLNP